jgi:hypothetical protein
MNGCDLLDQASSAAVGFGRRATSVFKLAASGNATFPASIWNLQALALSWDPIVITICLYK